MKLCLICANDATSNCLVCFLNNILPILQTSVSLTDCFLMCESSYLPQFPSSAVGFVGSVATLEEKKGRSKEPCQSSTNQGFSMQSIIPVHLEDYFILVEVFLILIHALNINMADILTLSFISKSGQTDNPSIQLGPRYS